MRIEVDLPDGDQTEWVLSKLHEHGLRVCNDVTCVRVLAWREVPVERPHVEA